MKITLYGYGYVGRALFDFLKDHYHVQVVDPAIPVEDAEKIRALGHTVFKAGHDVPPTEHAVLCVPTPMSEEDNSCDTSIVEEILERGDHEIYLVKSTVKPGTIDRLKEKTGKRIVFSPEYIGEGKYEIPHWLGFPHPTNMKVHDFHIFGGDRADTREWVNVWQRVAGWTPRYMQTTALQAELVKYFENMFLATKKIFCDEMYEVCEAFGADYNEVKELWLCDGRIGRPMTLIFPNARGYSGKCLPKDTNAIVRAAQEKGYEPELFKEVIRSNARFRNERSTV